MAYLLWFIAAVILVLVVKKYRDAKSKHQAAGNVVFAKYTFDKLSAEDQFRVKEKAVEIASAPFRDEVEQYGWYAVAMHALNIPSAVPDNPSWYHAKRPDVLRPSELMVRAILTFLNKNYSLEIDIAGISAIKKEQLDKAEEDLGKLAKPDKED